MAVKEIELSLMKVTVLNRCGAESGHGLIVMHAISEKEEKEIQLSSLEDEDGKPSFSVAGKVFKGDKILAYGEMNLKSPVCLDLIEKLPILSPKIFDNLNWLPSNIDFARGVAVSDSEGVIRWTQTWNKLTWFKYHLALIGNPKRVIVYRLDGYDYELILKALSK